MIGSFLLVLGRDHHGLAFGTHENLVLGALEIVHIHQTLAAARRKQGRLIDEVGQIRTGHAGGAAGQDIGAHIGCHRYLAHVNQQNLLAAPDIRQADHHLAVETARAQKCGVKHVGPVGRGNHDHARGRLEAVHLDQQLVQRLFAFVVAATQACAALTADRVDLVDEDDAGRILLGLFEHVAHAGRPHTDEHLDEIGTRDAEKRHLGFACDGTREQRLAGTGRADHQHAARNAATELLEFGRILQKIDQFGNVLLGFVTPGNIGERDRIAIFVEKARTALAEREGAAAAAALHLAHEENPYADQQQHGEP